MHPFYADKRQSKYLEKVTSNCSTCLKNLPCIKLLSVLLTVHIGRGSELSLNAAFVEAHLKCQNLLSIYQFLSAHVWFLVNHRHAMGITTLLHWSFVVHCYNKIPATRALNSAIELSKWTICIFRYYN